jgi:hypothetical protein
VFTFIIYSQRYAFYKKNVTLLGFKLWSGLCTSDYMVCGNEPDVGSYRIHASLFHLVNGYRAGRLPVGLPAFFLKCILNDLCSNGWCSCLSTNRRPSCLYGCEVGGVLSSAIAEGLIYCLLCRMIDVSG